MAIPVYLSDVTDAVWALLAPLLPPPKPRGRPRTVDLRRIVNGRFYVLRTGCAWRYLPREYGPWQTVYWYFRQWRLDGPLAQVHARLRELAQLHAGRDPTPRAAIIALPVGQDADGWDTRLRWGEAIGWRQTPHPGRH